MSIGTEIFLIFLLVIANGLFSMAEMAVVSSRKARLRQRSEEGSRGATLALQLAESPENFLSTVQVGITLIGMLTGAFGGATIAEELAAYLKQFPTIAPYSQTIGISIVVLILSYLSLILGELVPKSIALSNPESIASRVAHPLRALALLASPMVRFLTFSTHLVLKLLPLTKNDESPVTEEEIKVLIAQGTKHGTFAEAEQEMVEGVFRLGDQRVMELMRPRRDVTWLDIEDSWEINEKKIAESVFSRFLVAEGDLDRLIGMVHVKDLLTASRGGKDVDLRALARKPLSVPETKPALEVVELFRKTGEGMAVVVDEHGSTEGIITLADLAHTVIGELRLPGVESPSQAVQREDGTWLMDGSIRISDLIETLSWREMPGDEEGFTTLGGFVLAHLNRIPSPGDRFTVDNWQFEVVDMDGNRIDKVLIGPALPEHEQP